MALSMPGIGLIVFVREGDEAVHILRLRRINAKSLTWQ